MMDRCFILEISGINFGTFRLKLVLFWSIFGKNLPKSMPPCSILVWSNFIFSLISDFLFLINQGSFLAKCQLNMVMLGPSQRALNASRLFKLGLLGWQHHRPPISRLLMHQRLQHRLAFNILSVRRSLRHMEHCLLCSVLWHARNSSLHISGWAELHRTRIV